MNNSQIKLITLNTINDKIFYKQEIQKFFLNIFNKQLDNFEHLFTHNPFGSAIVIALTPTNNIVGMGHLLKQSFFMDNEKFNIHLLTSSMISKDYRKTRLYFDILDEIKKYSYQENIDFILAFPNANALPILTTFGGFKKLNTFNWIQLKYLPKSLYAEIFDFDMDFLIWRFSRFKYFYTKIDNKIVIYKNYNDNNDILSICGKKILKHIHLEEKNMDISRNIIIADIFLKNLQKNLTTIHSNQVVYYPIQKKITNLSFSPIFSDVF